jgi:hypothetical protein
LPATDKSAVHVLLTKFYPDFIWILEKIWIKGGKELVLCRGIWYGNLQFWPKWLFIVQGSQRIRNFMPDPMAGSD